jgi:hypothetical protein
MAPLFGRIIPALNRAFKRKKVAHEARRAKTIKDAVGAVEARRMSMDRKLNSEISQALKAGKAPSHWPKDVQARVKAEKGRTDSTSSIRKELRKRGIMPKD